MVGFRLRELLEMNTGAQKEREFLPSDRCHFLNYLICGELKPIRNSENALECSILPSLSCVSSNQDSFGVEYVGKIDTNWSINVDVAA